MIRPRRYGYPDPLETGAVRAGRPVDLLGGEQRTVGHIYNIRGWDRWSDRKRLAFLRQLAERYGEDPAMRWFVVQNVLGPAGIAPMDNQGQAAALLNWVQTQIYYANEPGEQIQSPWRTLKERTGDCDDMTLLLATMAHSIGLGFKFAVAGVDRQGRPIRWIEGERFRPGNYSHIYLRLGWPALNPTTWASAEATLRGTPLGFDVVEASPLNGPRRADLPGYGAPPVAASASPAVAPPAAPGAGLPSWWPSPGELAREVAIGVAISVGTALALRSIDRRR